MSSLVFYVATIAIYRKIVRTAQTRAAYIYVHFYITWRLCDTFYYVSLILEPWEVHQMAYLQFACTLSILPTSGQRNLLLLAVALFGGSYGVG
eukprot:3791995-Pyramimonas_sp.AAC.2